MNKVQVQNKRISGSYILSGVAPSSVVTGDNLFLIEANVDQEVRVNRIRVTGTTGDSKFQLIKCTGYETDPLYAGAFSPIKCKTSEVDAGLAVAEYANDTAFIGTPGGGEEDLGYLYFSNPNKEVDLDLSQRIHLAAGEQLRLVLEDNGTGTTYHMIIEIDTFNS